MTFQMTRILLSLALVSISTGLMAQREYSAPIPVEPRFGLDASRGTDTLVISSVEDAFNNNTLAIYGSVNGGWVVGTNGYGDVAKAQQFLLLDGPMSIDELVVFFGGKIVTVGGANSTLKGRIYGMNGTGTSEVGGPGSPAPGTVLAEASISIDDADTTGLLTGFTFPTPIWISGDFAAGVDFSGLAAGDSIGIVTTTDGSSFIGDYSWEKLDNGQWWTLLYSWPLDLDLVVLPVFTPSAASVGEEGWLNNMRMSFLGGNPARDNVTVVFESRETANMKLHVMDVLGHTVLEKDLGNRPAGEHQQILNTSNWGAGAYYVTLRSNGMPFTKKLIVE
jgi:hypothetical protein